MVFCGMLHSLNKVKVEEDNFDPFNTDPIDEDTYFRLNDGNIYVLERTLIQLTGPVLEKLIPNYGSLISEMHIGPNLTTIGSDNGEPDKIHITNPHTLTFRSRSTNIILKRYCFHNSNSTSITFTDNMILETNCLIGSAITSLDLSPITNYTTMAPQTFGNSSNLTSITFGPYLTNISSWCFASCNSLISITMPMNITNIGIYSFSYNNNLTTVIYNNITYINNEDFEFAFRTNGGTIYTSEFNNTPFEAALQVTGLVIFDGGNTGDVYISPGYIIKISNTPGWSIGWDSYKIQAGTAIDIMWKAPDQFS